MKQEQVLKLLNKKEYNGFGLNKNIIRELEKYNIILRMNETRIILIKEYRTKESFLNWEFEDQTVIASILNDIPSKFFNSLYYFMVIDFIATDTDSRLEINKIEKNDYICKKVIIRTSNDFDRMPFLTNKKFTTDEFDFDKKFKEKMLSFNNESTGNNTLNLKLILDNYFENYLTEDSKNSFNKILKQGD